MLLAILADAATAGGHGIGLLALLFALLAFAFAGAAPRILRIFVRLLSTMVVIVAIWISYRQSVAAWLLLVGGLELWGALAVWALLRGRFMQGRDTGVVLGRTARGLPHAVAVAGTDRFMHMHVLGPTGSGKSTGVLAPMLRQDIGRRDVGVTLLDPKGDLADEALTMARVAGREVVSFGPGLKGRIDLLAGEPAAAAETVAYAFEKAFGGDNAFYRTFGSTLLRYSIMAIKEAQPGAGLLALLTFLGSEERRREIFADVTDAHVRSYFRDQVASLGSTKFAEYSLGLRSQLAAVLANPFTREAVGEGGGTPVSEILAEGKVLIARLPVQELGIGASVLGALLLLAIQKAAFSRADSGPPHFLYVDEFQTFATDGFADFLAAARSYRVGAVLAHQNLDQLPSALKAGVLANARTRVLLGGLPLQDIERLKESLGERIVFKDTVSAMGAVKSRQLTREPLLRPEEVRGLRRGLAVVQGIAAGQVQPPVLTRLAR